MVSARIGCSKEVSYSFLHLFMAADLQSPFPQESNHFFSFTQNVYTVAEDHTARLSICMQLDAMAQCGNGSVAALLFILIIFYCQSSVLGAAAFEEVLSGWGILDRGPPPPPFRPTIRAAGCRDCGRAGALLVILMNLKSGCKQPRSNCHGSRPCSKLAVLTNGGCLQSHDCAGSTKCVIP